MYLNDQFQIPEYKQSRGENVMSIFSQFSFINGLFIYLTLLLSNFSVNVTRYDLCSFYLVNKTKRVSACNNSNNEEIYLFLPLATLEDDLHQVAALRGFVNSVEFLRVHFVVNNVFYRRPPLADYSL